MKALRWWLSLARPYAGWFLLGLLCSLITLLSNMALLAVSGWFVASMAAAGLAGTEMNYFTPAAIIRGLAIARTGGRYLERLISHDATLRLLTELRVWFYRQVEPLSTLELQGLRSGDLLGRIRSDIDTLDNVYLRLITPVVAGAITLAAAVAVLAYYDTAVAGLTLLLLLGAGGALPAWVEWRGREPGVAGVEISAQLKAAVVDTVEGLGELTVFGAMERQRRHIDRLTRRWLAQQARLSRLTGLSNAGLLLLTNLAVLGAAGLMVPQVRAGHLSNISFAPAILLVMGCFEAVSQMPGAWQALGQTLAATRRVRAFEQLRPAITEPEQPAPPPQGDELRLQGMGVRYGADAPWALADVTLTIGAGERIAVVGASGAGKSTLISVLARLVDYQRGEVLWDGQPLRRYRSADLRQRMAVVPQSVYLFHTSVRENLLVGDPQAGEQAMIEAARAAGIHDDISALPDGYDTIVGEEGQRLSGGQVRRIGIARALLRAAPLLLMDEPSEGLDTATEAHLWERLDAYLQGRTLILVTHRMAWVRHVDRILVFDHGRLVASGEHEELLRTSAHYQRLCSRLDSRPADHSRGRGKLPTDQPQTAPDPL